MLINPNTTTGKAQISQHMKSDQPICSLSGESLHSFLDTVEPQLLKHRWFVYHG